MMSNNKYYQNKISDYEDTVFAILGFMNLYRFDDNAKAMRSNVKVFQGRRLSRIDKKTVTTGEEKQEIIEKRVVTPDIGIIYSETEGILAEVKKSFCKNREHWINDFEQILSYDGIIEDWPTHNGKLDKHEIALLVHQTRARAVADYYQQHKNEKISFSNPFTIIEFNRSDEASPFLFFRTLSGSLGEEILRNRLHEGVSVSMEKLSGAYSEIKLYDALPPYPYLLELIWTNIILPIAIQDERFLHMRKNGKIDIKVEIEHVINVLFNSFSFKKLHGDEPNQPRIPCRDWIVEAFEILILAGEGKWVEKENGVLSVVFKKHTDVLEHFIEICSTYSQEMEEAEQTSLFDANEERKKT
jgi:hypothetical protein